MAASILVRPHPEYLPEQSRPEAAHYSFAYTIEIENLGPERVQLLERHWVITDADGQQTEVQGPGVVGEQPFISPGKVFRYQSNVSFNTPVGFMQGSYTLQDEQGELFKVDIPLFTLAVPHQLH